MGELLNEMAVINLKKQNRQTMLEFFEESY